MKTILTALFVLTTASTAFGRTLVCENGDINVVGDAYQSYEISDKGISYRGWEWGYEVAAADVTYNGKTAVVQNKAIEYWAEGDIYHHVLNEMMVLSEDKKTLQVTSSLDGEAFQSQTLGCVIK